MTNAYVHIVADAGAVSQAATQIAELDAVSVVHIVTGEYDIIAQLDLDTLDDLPEVVADQIHSITGVGDTVTNIAFEP
ncbi:Lrp/AsnC family transcriptional regulator [Haladaptatus halobius]|uniref:Lrp/AsnC family transcriptional regulator n=1 Tax=Haladaptatus halobius TaxID=2884875 RepID=UPI001D0B7A04|nr:Lrp/AsnC family transcriptional regulator [Haladaptatus halobius]